MAAATSVRKLIHESSNAQPGAISGVAYELRHTFAADTGMAFELALKSVKQGLSPHEDGDPQVLNSHNLLHLWEEEIPQRVRSEVDHATRSAIRARYGFGGRILSFSEYVTRHEEFLNRAVANRYAIPAERRWKSDLLFVVFGGLPVVDKDSAADGMGTLLEYWRAIMRQALALRWPDEACSRDPGLGVDRDDAWALVEWVIANALR